MNSYINKLSCWYIEQRNYMILHVLVRSTSVGLDIANRVDPDRAQELPDLGLLICLI